MSRKDSAILSLIGFMGSLGSAPTPRFWEDEAARHGHGPYRVGVDNIPASAVYCNVCQEWYGPLEVEDDLEERRRLA